MTTPSNSGDDEIEDLEDDSHDNDNGFESHDSPDRDPDDEEGGDSTPGEEKLEIEPGNKVFFIWGPPLSGQLRWMCSEAWHLEKQVSTVLLPLELHNPQPSLVAVIERLQSVLDDIGTQKKGGPDFHVYCELPWDTVYEDMVLEEWIKGRADLFKGEHSWQIYFAGMVPADAERLGSLYRRGLEEFSRSSHSTMMILRSEVDDDESTWVNTKKIDFGRRVDIIEEVLWPAPIDDSERAAPLLADEPLLAVSLPTLADEENLLELMRGFQTTEFGTIWGAEVVWRHPKGGLQVLSYSLGQIFRWEASHPTLDALAPPNGAMLSVVGVPLREDAITAKIKTYLYS